MVESSSNLEPNAVVNPLKINRFLGSYYGEIKLPLDGLKYRANIGIDFHSRQDYSFLSSNARQGNPNQAKNATQQTYAYTFENLLFYDKSLENTLSELLYCNLFSVIEPKV